ncbi:hypothetical protein ACJX0J_023135, partial [Zea mays]
MLVMFEICQGGNCAYNSLSSLLCMIFILFVFFIKNFMFTSLIELLSAIDLGIKVPLCNNFPTQHHLPFDPSPRLLIGEDRNDWEERYEKQMRSILLFRTIVISIPLVIVAVNSIFHIFV